MGPEIIELLRTGYVLYGVPGVIGAGLAVGIWLKLPAERKEQAKSLWGLLKKKEPEK
jgi:hypothetical protein